MTTIHYETYQVNCTAALQEDGKVAVTGGKLYHDYETLDIKAGRVCTVGQWVDLMNYFWRRSNDTPGEECRQKLRVGTESVEWVPYERHYLDEQTNRTWPTVEAWLATVAGISPPAAAYSAMEEYSRQQIWDDQDDPEEEFEDTRVVVSEEEKATVSEEQLEKFKEGYSILHEAVYGQRGEGRTAAIIQLAEYLQRDMTVTLACKSRDEIWALDVYEIFDMFCWGKEHAKALGVVLDSF